MWPFFRASSINTYNIQYMYKHNTMIDEAMLKDL